MLVRVLLLLTVLGVASSGVTRAQPDVLTEHVVMISVDGLRPDFYLDLSWPAPMLQRMAREGAHARAVRGVFPSVTYPSHTTLVTGALPARHGILYNTPFEADGQTGRWYWEFDSVRVPTLWQAVRDAGKTTASIFWPVTVGAPIDRNVPEVWSLDEKMSMVEAIRKASHPAGLLDELEREATGRLVLYDSTGPVISFAHSWWDPRRTDAAEYLLSTARPNLITMHLIATDEAQHDHGREGSEVRQAVAAADHEIARLVEAVERLGIARRTAFVVVGDHGFIDVSTQLAPNVWLAEAGLMEATRDRGNWRATFHTTGGSAFLHLRNPEDRATLTRVEQLLETLPRGVWQLFRVVDREELTRLGADPSVPLALAAMPGVAFTSSGRGPAVRAGAGSAHGYLPDLHPDIYTGFLAWGAGVRARAVVPLMGMEDVAPFVAALLGISFDAPDGLLRPGLLAAK